MPVEAQTVEYSYLGDGVSVTFPFPSKFLTAADILVGVNGAPRLAGFTVSGAGQENGGNVTFSAPPLVNERVLLLRAPAASQLIDFVNGQTVLENTLDTGLDKLTMLIQYILRDLSRTVKLDPLTAETPALTLPAAAERANKVFAFDGAGNPTFALPAGTALPTLLASQAEAEAGTDNTKLMTPLRTKQAFGTSAPAYLRKRKTMLGLGVPDGLAASRSAQITAALAALEAGDYVDGQNLVFRIDTATSLPLAGFVMENITFDTSQSAANVYPLSMLGSQGAGVAVSTSLVKGVYQVTVASTAGLARGDDVLFARSGYATGAGFAFDGLVDTWWTTVDTVVNATTLTLRDAYPHSWSMPTAPGTLLMYKPTMARGHRFINVSCQRTGAPTDFTHFFRADYARDLKWEGGKIDGPRESGMLFLRGRNWRISELRTLGQNHEGLGYPVAIVGGNEEFWVQDCTFEDCRHAVTTGGTAGIERNGFIERNVVRGARSAGIDVHPASDGITIKGNKLYLANKERDLFRGVPGFETWGNGEGLTYQGANGRIIDNEIYGLSGANTAANDRPGVFVQALTRQPEDTFVVNGNRVTNVIGAGVIGYFIQNQKLGGDIQSLDMSHNHFHATDYGGAGALSPIGISIESHPNGTEFYNTTLSNNTIRARSTALRLIVGATRYMRSVGVTGGTYETINNDAPVIDISAGAANRIERVDINGGNLLGGNFSVRNTGAGRVTWSGGTAGGFATAAVSGTVTQPAGAANEVRT